MKPESLEALAAALAPHEVGALAGGPPSGLPLNDGACEWVTSRVGRELTDIEQELVTVICEGLRFGPWNVHKSWSILRSGPGWASISTTRDLATYDIDTLTRLVFAAHDRCVRLEVRPSGPGRIELFVSQRGREGELSRRHPTLEAAVAEWRTRWPLETP